MSSLIRVFQYCRQYPGYAIATLLCALLSTGVALVPPGLTGWTIDEVLKKARPEWLLYSAGGIFIAYFLRDFLNSLRIQFNNQFEQRVVFDLRRDLYAKMQCLPMFWFDKQSTGDLVTRVSEDVMAMERVLIDGIEQGTVSVLQILAVSVLLFVADFELTLIALIPVPLLAVGAWMYTSTAHLRYRMIRKATSAMNSLLLDNLQGIFQIKSFAREKKELAEFESKAGEVKAGTLKVMHAWSIYSPTMSFLGAVGFVLVIYFGGLKVMEEGSTFSIGDLTAFLLYIGLLYEPVNRLHQLNQLAQAGRAAAERVFKILDEGVEEEPGQPAKLPLKSSGGRAVHFQNVQFRYEEETTVLKGIHFQAEPGQTVALVGPTGAGKSTIINLIPRFYRATEGSILIDGVAINEISLAELRQEIATVSQEAFLFDRTVRENLKIGNESASEDEMWSALTAANAADFVRALPKQLDTELGERGVRLSVGEKQRVSIARALLQDSPILILDEATASVDTRTERLIQEALDRLMEGRTSFIIAHRLSTVRSADLILVIEGGRIIESGTHQTLQNAGGLYAKLCSAQSSHHTIEESWEELST